MEEIKRDHPDVFVRRLKVNMACHSGMIALIGAITWTDWLQS